ncbi:hypothetical protein UFOVP1202_20 [uncultured Caudovirales phage]|uniref:Uncharacterized protein n=1 Tax=uncultured Caudovirales phage TaxID=2100421 RepID=A0A6J5R8Y4_9CAUD|nr:hypothetical protein UFOVP1202_20 [uncultured Caudovirales phage]
MAVITVAGPNGNAKFEIAGEKPTQEELAAIFKTLNPDKASPQVPNIGTSLSQATPEQIREYARMRKQAGITPEGKAMSEEERAAVPYEEQGVDYTQGLQDSNKFSRFGYGRMDTDQERANYLSKNIGKDTFRKDPLGRFILTQKGRDALGMGKGPEVSIDEEGLSWGDVKEFMGQAAVPTAAGIGAALTFSGVGTIPGILIAGAAGAAGKALDEGIESAQGLQDQSFGDVMRDSAYEGAFSMAGEGVGRGISKVFGRIIKGAGGAENEALRAQGRDLIERGFKPTVGGATNEQFRPILNRMQALYENVFPNRKAATQNLDLIVKELRDLRIVNNGAIDDLSDAVRRDMDKLYATADEDLLAAQKNLDVTTKKYMGDVMAGLRKDGIVPKDLAQVLQLRKRMFDEQTDSLYSKATKVLRGQAIIPTAGIKKELNRLVTDSAADIGNTKFARMVSELPEFATVQDVSRIRTALADASYSPSLVADVNVGALGALRSSITSALDGTEVSLARAIGMPAADGAKIVGPKDFNASFQEMSDALGLLRRTNNLYRAGMKRFDNVVTQSIMKQAQMGQLNKKFIFDQIIQKDNPEALQQLLKAVRGAKYIEGLPMGERTAAQQLVNGMTVDQARKEMALLPANSQARRLLAQQIARVEGRTAEVEGMKGAVNPAEDLRQDLARMYLQDVAKRSLTIDSATGAELIDPVKFSAIVREKGSVFDLLFRGEKKPLNDLISVLERGKADLAPSVIDDLMSRNAPLADSLTQLKSAQAAREALDKNRFLNTLASGDIDNIGKEVLRTSENISAAKNALSPEVMEGVKDAAMGRILQQADIATSADGTVKMTEDFVDAFRSGRLGNRLQNIINSYGDDNLDALFGSGTAKALNTVAADMVRTSNKTIIGKSGLAGAAVALSLSGAHLIFSPLTVLPTAAAFAVMSKALRNPKVLKALMASRNPNTLKQFLSGKFLTNDPIAQGFQVMQSLIAQATLQTSRGAYAQGKQEVMPAINYAEQNAPAVEGKISNAIQNNPVVTGVEKMASDATQMILGKPAPGGTPQVRPQISPILVPNPTTRATFGQ